MKVRPNFSPNRAIARRTPKTGKDDKVTTYLCTAPEQDELVQDVRTCLSEELRKKDYRDHPNPVAGHCYVASEVLFHKVGGKAAGWTPQTVRHEGGSHWFLKNQNGDIVDPTADQFETPVPYDQARGCGFLTKQPSKRAQVVLNRLDTLA